jgi:hypothetical protein
MRGLADHFLTEQQMLSAMTTGGALVRGRGGEGGVVRLDVKLIGL